MYFNTSEKKIQNRRRGNFKNEKPQMNLKLIYLFDGKYQSQPRNLTQRVYFLKQIIH